MVHTNDTAFQYRPKSLYGICSHFTNAVYAVTMVNARMFILVGQIPVAPFVTVYGAASLYGLVYFGTESFCGSVLYHFGNNLATSLQHTEYRCLVLETSTSAMFDFFVLMSILVFASYESFVNFHYTVKFQFLVLFPEALAYAVKHCPCSLLRHPNVF